MTTNEKLLMGHCVGLYQMMLKAVDEADVEIDTTVLDAGEDIGIRSKGPYTIGAIGRELGIPVEDCRSFVEAWAARGLAAHPGQGCGREFLDLGWLTELGRVRAVVAAADIGWSETPAQLSKAAKGCLSPAPRMYCAAIADPAQRYRMETVHSLIDGAVEKTYSGISLRSEERAPTSAERDDVDAFSIGYQDLCKSHGLMIDDGVVDQYVPGFGSPSHRVAQKYQRVDRHGDVVEPYAYEIANSEALAEAWVRVRDAFCQGVNRQRSTA